MCRTLAAERRQYILRKLLIEKKVLVSEMSAYFEVSEETIRRDLDKLEQDGYAVKSYGGALLKEGNIEMPYSIRQTSNLLLKEKMASIIADMVEPGEHIILDASTTALAIEHGLKEKQDLTILTNSMEIILEQPDGTDWEIISTGGYYMDTYKAFVGPRTIEMLENFNVDKAILSCKCIDMEKGLTDSNEMFSRAKYAMLKNAKEKILAVDHTKFDTVGFYKIADVSDVDIVVTDQKPSEEWLAFFDSKGIRCLYE